MSTTEPMLQEDDLGPADQALLDMLQEGRVTAPFAAEECDYNTQYVRDRLARLVEHGHVQKVYKGLYELVDDPRDGSDRGARELSVDTEVAPEPTARCESDESDASADIDAVLDGWRPGRSGGTKREQRVAAGRATLEYLRDRGAATASEIKTEVEAEHPVEGQSQDTWWKKTAREALKRGQDHGLVMFKDGVKEWRWVGGE